MTSHASPTSDAALQRLEHAIDRLEKAFAGKQARLEATTTAKAAPSDDLFGGDELTRARQDYSKLDAASRQVEARIDEMVDRLQTMLEV